MHLRPLAPSPTLPPARLLPQGLGTSAPAIRVPFSGPQAPAIRPHLTLSSHSIPVPPELPPPPGSLPCTLSRTRPPGAVLFHPKHLKGSCLTGFFPTPVFPQENVGPQMQGPCVAVTHGGAAHNVLCLAAHSRVTLRKSMHCSPPGSSAHRSLQERTLEWVATPSSRGSSHPGIKPGPPALQVASLPAEPPGNPKEMSTKGRD